MPRSKKSKPGQPKRSGKRPAPQRSASWVRKKIRWRRGRKLQVLIYARYSTDEQNPRSIEDQVAFCKAFLEDLGVDLSDVEITVLFDRGISGEIVSRPGIDEVRSGILEHRWDLILSEDASRLYRHETACGELVEEAVDQGVRVICANDFVDTAHEDWDDRLHEALRHHAKANRYTSRRIKRAHDGLWEMGAAVGPLRPGYRRIPSKPATHREPAQGPFFDQVDGEWQDVIHEGYERIAAGDKPQAVARFFTEQGLPRAGTSSTTTWDERAVRCLIQNPMYRGEELFRKEVSRKQHRTGKRKAVRNRPRDVQIRDMPHLRIVWDSLWRLANDAIEGRRTTDNSKSGRDNPLWGIPRDSRRALSNVLVCGVCGDKTYDIGPNGYRCQNIKRNHLEDCWNRATTRKEVAHAKISEAIRAELQRFRETNLAAAVATVTEILERNDRQTAEQKRLLDAKQRLETRIENLLDIAESGSKRKKSKRKKGAFYKRIRLHERNLDRVRNNLQFLEEHTVLPPTESEVSQHIDALDERLQRMDRDVRDDLARLVGTIRTVPHQQFGKKLVVLFGRCELSFFQLFPARVRLVLANRFGEELPEILPACLKPVGLQMELFERTTPCRFWREALHMTDAGIGPSEVARRLGITQRQAALARDYGRRLRSAGLDDPYSELTAPPPDAARWRPHGRSASARRSENDSTAA